MAEPPIEFSPNIRRKVAAMDLEESPTTVTVRLKSRPQALKFEQLRRAVRDTTGNSGGQKTFEFVLELAWRYYIEDVHRAEEVLEEATAGGVHGW